MNKTEYLLVCLMEEAAEVQQIAAKCLRFGLDNYHPNDSERKTNFNELRRELDDLDAIRVMLQTVIKRQLRGDYYWPTIQEKENKVFHYMNVSRDCGTLQDQAGEGENQ